MLEDSTIWDVKPMKLADAVAFVEAGRQNYNKNCPEDRRSFGGIVEMMDEDLNSCGTDEDAACLNALSIDYQKALKQFQKAYFKQLADSVDPVRVKAMLADPALFD